MPSRSLRGPFLPYSGRTSTFREETADGGRIHRQFSFADALLAACSMAGHTTAVIQKASVRLPRRPSSLRGLTERGPMLVASHQAALLRAGSSNLSGTPPPDTPNRSPGSRGVKGAAKLFEEIPARANQARCR